MDDFYGVAKLIEEHGGIENFRCFVQLGMIEVVTPFGVCLVSGDKRTWAECRIDESRYKISDGYKITLRSIDPRFSYDHFYQCDFMSLVRAGHIIIKESDAQYIKHIRWFEPISGAAYLVNEADVVVDVIDV